MIRRNMFTRKASVVVAWIVCITNSASAEVTFDFATVGNPGNAADPLISVAIPAIGSLADAEKSEDAVPEGLTDSDWKSIRQEYERHRHAAVAVDGEFRARNPGQQWLTHFDGRGFTVEPAIAGVEPEAAGWRWGLELQSYGFPGHERAISGQAKMTAQNDRVTYDWDAGLREWFVNDRGGLEHGFTLASRPPGAGDSHLGAGKSLELRLAVRGGLRAHGHADGRGVSFVNEEGHAVVHYAGLKVWDADNRELPARIDADATGLRLAVDERGARYPLTIDPIAQQAYLKASNTGVSDQFGISVAVSGDTVVVGAYWEDSNATGVNGNQSDNNANSSGAAYVFVRDGGGMWSQQAYLKASNTGVSDQFGRSVGVSGDTVVVGAGLEDSNTTGVNGNQADNSASFSGAAYVFVREGGGVWNQKAYLKASNTDAFDAFGSSVAVSGDAVLVGALGEDSNATGVNGNQAENSAFGSGAAYVFVRDGGDVWSQQAYLKASNTDAGDWFGFSVAVSGDTVVVGAHREASNATGVNGNQADNSAFRAGAAYVFVRDGGVWSQQAYLKASNTGAVDEFGRSVAVSGDTVVVGAHREASNATGVNGNQANNSAEDSGAAYVFVRDGGGVWSQQAYLKASNTDIDDRFGISVAVSGDTVVVGAHGEDSNASGVNGNQADNNAVTSGAAYVFIIECAPPEIICPVPVTIECDEDDSPDHTGLPQVFGGCGKVTIDFDDDIQGGECPQEQTIFRTWIATDENGDSATCTQPINVVDTSEPEITCPDDITIISGDSTAPGATGGATATDVCDQAVPTIVSENEVTIPDCLADPIAFTFAREWTATDDCGNSSSCVQTITVLRRVVILIIKQGACPAPLNLNSNGVLPTVLPGDADFNVEEVLLSSLLLSRADCVGGDVAPVDGPPGPPIRIQDLNHPYEGEGPCACSENHSSDGIADLSLKFRVSELATEFEVDNGEDALVLSLTGVLNDGSAFLAADCILIVPPGADPINATVESNVLDTFIEVTPLDLNVDSDGFANFGRAYFPDTLITVTAPPHSAGRPFLRWKVDGVLQTIGLRTLEVEITSDVNLEAIYKRASRIDPEPPTEDSGDME